MNRWTRPRVVAALILAGASLASAQPAVARPLSNAPKFQPASDTLPPDFRGRIVYQGSFSAEASRAGRAPAHASDIVRRIARGNNRSWSEEGTVTVTVEFNGSQISGSHVGSGGMGRGSFTGTRNGRTCTISSGQGDSNTVDCTVAMWRGTSRSAPGARVESSVRIEARASSLVDFAEQEREQAVARARADEQRSLEAERQRLADAERARSSNRPSRTTRSAPVASPAPTASGSHGQRNGGFRSQLAEALRRDAGAWSATQLEANSETDVGIMGREGDGTVYRLNYRFSGYRGENVPGWIEGLFIDGQLQQIRYHDFGYWAGVRSARTPRADPGYGRPCPSRGGVVAPMYC